MGLFDEIAGAVVAVEGTKKVDSDAGLFTEAAAAVAGFEGVKVVEEHFENKDENQS